MAQLPQLRTALRPYQQQAVDNGVTEFVLGAPRCRIDAPPGSGKTLIALHIVNRMAPAGTSIVVVPTLDLLEQTAGEWHKEGRPGRYLALSGDRDLPRNPALRGILTAVTDAATLAAELSQADGPVNVFATYHSLGKVADAHRLFHMPPWDVLVCDEAHRTAGNLHKPWAQLLDAHRIFAHHRLFTTATPRNFRPIPGQDLPVDIEVASMDDFNLYGQVVFRLSLADAIDRGLLADYRIVAVDVEDADLRTILNRNPMLAADSEGLRVAAAQVALQRAMHKHDLRRVLVFCPRIAVAEIFAETLPETAALMPKRLQGPLQVGTVNCNQSRYDRLTQVSAFKEASLTSSDKKPLRAVLTNCMIFAEGVDVPAIDAVLFTSPKTSTYQIVQAVGRALRPVPGQAKVAHIIVPIYKAPGQNLADAAKGTPFHILYQVLFALSLYDEHVFHRVFQLRHSISNPLHPAARPERADELIPLLRPYAEDPHNSIWEIGLECARRYREQHGHLKVPSSYCGPDRFYLGWWLGNQRSLRMNHSLKPERFEALDALGMIWEHPRTSIEHRLDIARAYHAQHGHLSPVPGERFRGMDFGRWINTCRNKTRRGQLPYCYQRALTEINPWWNAGWDKHGHWRRIYARALAAARRGELAFPDLAPDSDDRPLAHWLDQQLQVLPSLSSAQHNLLGALPLHHPLALLLRPPRSQSERAFAHGLRHAHAYWRAHQHLNVPYDHVVWDRGRSFRLGEWISDKRLRPYRLTREQLDALEALDMRWTRTLA
ncbi:Helicase associated domain protein [Streptomyces xiangluensis]|uniref:Helicase associated domain protein n=1 Tax=Streptomyces xiangluensis TaxID=2665720 RepID=A0ABV8YYJ2_9ACTN